MKWNKMKRKQSNIQIHRDWVIEAGNEMPIINESNWCNSNDLNILPIIICVHWSLYIVIFASYLAAPHKRGHFIESVRIETLSNLYEISDLFLADRYKSEHWTLNAQVNFVVENSADEIIQLNFKPLSHAESFDKSWNHVITFCFQSMEKKETNKRVSSPFPSIHSNINY